MLRYITRSAGVILAAFGLILLVDAHTQATTGPLAQVLYLRAIHETLTGMGVILLAIFVALIVRMLPEDDSGQEVSDS